MRTLTYTLSRSPAQSVAVTVKDRFISHGLCTEGGGEEGGGRGW